MRHGAKWSERLPTRPRFWRHRREDKWKGSTFSDRTVRLSVGAM